MQIQDHRKFSVLLTTTIESMEMEDDQVEIEKRRRLMLLVAAVASKVVPLRRDPAQ
jgi:hypothetical protein